MKIIKIVFLLTLLCCINSAGFASENSLAVVNSIQERINSKAFNILNRNKIEKRVVFVYEDEDKKNFLTSIKRLQNGKL